jgi:hypothetical protein
LRDIQRIAYVCVMKQLIYTLQLIMLIGLVPKQGFGQANIENWWLNTTYSTYGGDTTGIVAIHYNTNYIFLEGSGIPDYFAAYAGESVFQPVDQDYVFRIKRNPTAETGTHTAALTGGIGLGLDGTPFYRMGDSKSWDVSSSSFVGSGADIWHSIAWEKEGLDMDGSLGHSTANGSYHHHVANLELFDNTDSSVHSPLIGYAFDGYPIYGPFGYSNPNDPNSTIERMTSSYQERVMSDRTVLPDGTVLTNPQDFGPTIDSSNPIGVCEEDYEYVSGLGTLDTFNGRWCVTPEYPCGTYAYFVTIDANDEPDFPYIIGYEFYGVVDYAVSAQFTGATIPGNAVSWTPGTNICDASITETLSDPSCNGSDGSISLSLDNFGDIPCIDWTDGSTDQNRTNLSAGTYTVTVSGNSCSVTANYTLNSSSGSTATVTGTDPTTCGGSDGEISFGPPTGTGPYQFSIDSGATFSTPMPPTFSGLSAGTYYAVLEDGNGCWEVTTVVLNSSSGPSIDNVSTTDVSCNAGSDGSIIITASGGTAPYTYSIDGGSTFQSSSSFTGLAAGTYNIEVMDASGCTSATTGAISEPTAITLSFSTSDPLCNSSCDGSVTVVASGGTAPFTYVWDANAGNQTTATAASLCDGSYSVTVTDANGCIATGTVTIAEPTAITINVSSTDVTCNGFCDGIASSTVTGGTAPYSYLWDDGFAQNTAIATNLCAGNYILTVTDANGCTATASVSIIEPNQLNFTSSTTDESCGLSDGTITLSASGGTTTYSYSIDGGATTQSTGMFTGLSGGTYNVLITDANGCTATGTVVVNSSGGTTIDSVSTLDLSCNGGLDGQIVIAVSGGTAPYTYSVDGGTTNQSSNSFSGLSAGTYSVLVTDASACTATSTVTLNEPTAITYTASSTDESCGQSDGTMTITAAGGTGSLTYSIDGGATFQSTGAFTGLSGGFYNVVIEDVNGCQLTGSETVNTSGGATIDSVSVMHISCNGSSDGQITIYATGAINYSINGGTSFQTSSTFTGLGAGNYPVMVEDASGCTANMMVTINEPAQISISLNTTDVSCNGLSDGSIQVSGTGGVGMLEYSIDGTNFGPNPNFSGLTAGAYTIIAQDVNGCQMMQTVTLIEPNPMSLIANITDEMAGGSDGAIDVTTLGGTPSYTFSWSNSAVTEDISNLSSGSYTLTVTDANGCQMDSTFFVDIVNGIGENSLQVEIYPNPTSDLVYIQLEKKDYLVQVFDMKGNLIFTHENIEQVDMSVYDKGVYILSVQTERGNYKRLRVIRL